jgi:cytochrome bd ubiquinol oxidase subunit II
MENALPYIWAGLLALAVFIYVLLDGFDLGIGILFPFANNDEDRDLMMTSVAPVWDGNETWLVLGGGGLFAAFPKAYAALMPSVYMPIGFMLIALIFRGVAFEFRFSSTGVLRRVWDQAFHWGSIVAAFSQGLILGAMVQGISLEDGRFAGGMFDWLTPFSFFTGCALVWGYALLGSTWLIIKTEGSLLQWARQMAKVAMIVMIICLVIVSITVPLLDVAAADHWGIHYPVIDWSQLLPLVPIPIATAVCCWLLIQSILDKKTLYKPFVYSIGIFALGYLGLIISFFPYLVPYSLTIEQAAAAANAQWLLLIGAVFLLPVILGYTAYVYWVFRGKVDLHAGYH